MKIFVTTLFVICAVQARFIKSPFGNQPLPHIAKTSEERAYLWSKIDFKNLKSKALVNSTKLASVPAGFPIINGRESNYCQFPFAVAIFFDNYNQESTFCTGSLISRRYVLTAAHCPANARTMTVGLGVHNIRQNEPTQVVYRLDSSAATIHPQYNAQQISNDLAVIALPEYVTLTNCISVITLASRNLASNSFVGYTGTQLGWGTTADNVPISNTLQYNQATVLSNQECARYFGNQVTNGNICTSGYYGAICHGDSGGPLVINNGGSYLQIGVSSFVYAKSCQQGWPSAFSRVTSFSDFIRSNTDVNV